MVSGAGIKAPRTLSTVIGNISRTGRGNPSKESGTRGDAGRRSTNRIAKSDPLFCEPLDIGRNRLRMPFSTEFQSFQSSTLINKYAGPLSILSLPFQPRRKWREKESVKKESNFSFFAYTQTLRLFLELRSGFGRQPFCQSLDHILMLGIFGRGSQIHRNRFGDRRVPWIHPRRR